MAVVRDVSVRLSVNSSQAIADVNRFGTAVDQNVSKIERGSARAGQAYDKIGRGARNLAIAGAATLGIVEKANISFDKQMSAVDAAYNLHGKNAAKTLDQLRQSAIKAGADTSFSATEAAAGVTELAKAGVSAREVIRGGLKGSLDLAAAGQISVAEAAETAASAMTQFGLKGTDVGHIADLLAAGAGKAQGSVSDMGQALNQSGLVAAQTGLSIEDTVGALTSFAKAGLTGSDAGTSFKTMLLSLNPRSKQAADLMKRYGIEAYDAQGKFVGLTQYAGRLRDGLDDLSSEQRARALQKIFGTDAIRAANIIYRDGAKGIVRSIRSVNDEAYASRSAGKLMDNLAGDWERLTGSLETAFIGGGGGFQKELRKIVQGADGLVDKFSELPDAVQGNVVKAIAGLTGAGGLLYAITKVKGGLDTLRGAKGLSAGVSLAKAATASRVVPVFVTNPGFGGTPVPGTQLKPGVPPVVPLAGSLASNLTGVGAIIAGIFAGTKFNKYATNSGEHNLAKDAKFVSSYQDRGSIGRGISKANDLLGNTDTAQAIKNIRALDAEMAAGLVSARDRADALNAYKTTLDKTGMSADQLNAILPRTAEGLKRLAPADAADHMRDREAALRGVNKATQDYRQVVKGIPKEIRSYVTTPGAALSMSSMKRLQRQYDLTPRQVRTIMQLQGFRETQIQAALAGQAYKQLPKNVRTAMSLLNGTSTKREIARIISAYQLTPKQVSTLVKALGTPAAVAALRDVKHGIDSLHDKTVRVNVVRGSTGKVGTQAGSGGVAQGKADGGTIQGERLPYGDKVLIAAAPGEEVITNRRGEADRFRADRAAGRIPAYADGGTVGLNKAGTAGASKDAFALAAGVAFYDPEAGIPRHAVHRVLQLVQR